MAVASWANFVIAEFRHFNVTCTPMFFFYFLGTSTKTCLQCTENISVRHPVCSRSGAHPPATVHARAPVLEHSSHQPVPHQDIAQGHWWVCLPSLLPLGQERGDAEPRRPVRESPQSWAAADVRRDPGGCLSHKGNPGAAPAFTQNHPDHHHHPRVL